MRSGDKQVGAPFEQYTDTKANIEALAGVGEGAIAYATDTDQLGTYNGTVWSWGGGGGAVDSVNGQTGVVVLDAGDIGTTPAGGLASTDVQAALNELDSEKAVAANTVMDGDAAGGDLTGTYPNPTVNINGKTSKATPVDADETFLADSAASFGTKKVTWSNVKAALKAYFDTLYAALVHTHKAMTLLSTHGMSGAVPAGGTRYLCPYMSGLQTGDWQQPATRAGTLKNFFFQAAWYQPGSGTLVVTVRINGVNTGITITVPAGGVLTYSDTTHTASIAAGDLVSFEVKNNATEASAQVGFCVVEFEYDAG